MSVQEQSFEWVLCIEPQRAGGIISAKLSREKKIVKLLDSASILFDSLRILRSYLRYNVLQLSRADFLFSALC